MNIDIIRLRDGVQIASGNNNTALLYAEGSMKPIQLGSSFWSIATLLRQGTTKDKIVDQLIQHYETHSPRQTSDAVDALLSQLKSNGYIDSGNNHKPPTQTLVSKSFYWSGLDKTLTQLIGSLPTIPTKIEIVLVSIVLMTSLATVTGFIVNQVDFIQSLFSPQSLNYTWLFVALVIVYIVFMPLHELAHGLAAKSAGVPVTGCGMFIKWFIFPAFFVEIRSALGATSPYKKTLIPLAGIIMDLLLLAILVVIITTSDAMSVRNSLLGYVFCTALFVAANNLNPMINSDGSKFLSAIFNDYAIFEGAFKGKRSVHTSTGKLWSYRVIGISYGLIFVTVIYQIIVR